VHPESDDCERREVRFDFDIVDLSALDLVGECFVRLTRGFRARGGTVKQIECSDDACVMSETETPARCGA
jgi:hypothetical protein